jgi:hypothetical protein
VRVIYSADTLIAALVVMAVFVAGVIVAEAIRHGRRWWR